MAPVKVEDISDKGDGTPSEKEQLFQLAGSATDAPPKEIQGSGEDAPPQNADEKKEDDVEKTK